MKSMNAFIIEKYLSTSGTILYPKADGRVEVSQKIINKMGWVNQKYIHVGSFPGEIYLSGSNNFKTMVNYLGKIKVSGGRIRIHAAFLKKCGFIDKPISVIISGDNIIARLNNTGPESVNKIKEFIHGFSENQEQQIFNFIIQDFAEVAPPIEKPKKVIPKKVIPKKVIPKKVIPKPELLLLNERNVSTLRFMGLPKRFLGFWSKKYNEVVVFKQDSPLPYHSNSLYLIPAIDKLAGGTFKIGYLLLNSKTYSTLIQSINIDEYNYKERDIIFWPNHYDYSRFRVYSNPPTKINHEINNKAEEIFLNAKNFLYETFRTVSSIANLTDMPALTKQNVRLYEGPDVELAEHE